MNQTRHLAAALLLAVTASLAACGGGNDDDAPPPVALTGPGDAPDSVAQSVSNFLDYLMSVAGLQTETAEPVGINGLQPPASDTDEPAQVS